MDAKFACHALVCGHVHRCAYGHVQLHSRAAFYMRVCRQAYVHEYSIGHDDLINTSRVVAAVLTTWAINTHAVINLLLKLYGAITTYTGERSMATAGRSLAEVA